MRGWRGVWSGLGVLWLRCFDDLVGNDDWDERDDGYDWALDKLGLD
jgi:hypothetical protein